MQLNTPIAESLRIVLAGNRNAGKSSLLNSIFQKDVAIVSDVAGTTTDPVSRKIELFPVGPCVITDTAGLDDTGDLGDLRIEPRGQRSVRPHNPDQSRYASDGRQDGRGPRGQ